MNLQKNCFILKTVQTDLHSSGSEFYISWELLAAKRLYARKELPFRFILALYNISTSFFAFMSYTRLFQQTC